MDEVVPSKARFCAVEFVLSEILTERSGRGQDERSGQGQVC